MNKRPKHIYRIYHQLNTDVWGNISEYRKAAKVSNLKHKSRLSRLSIVDGQPQKMSINNKYETLRQIKKYYLNVSKKFLDRIINNRNYYIKKYFSIINILEARLDVILYRINLSSSLNHARQIINHGYIMVNGSVINQTNILISVGDIISVKDTYINQIKNNILDRMNTGYININSSRYIEVNYNTMQVILIHYPENYQIPYPNINNLSEVYNYIC